MSFSSIPMFLLTAVVFLVMISVLVAAHEYGHYFFARLFNMGVEEFAIGMGKKLKVWKRKTYDLPVAFSYRHNPDEVSKGSAFEGGDRLNSGRVIETDKGQVLRETTEFTVRALPIGGFVRIKGMIPDEMGSETKVPGGFYSKPPWQRLIVLLAGPAASVLSGLLVLIVLYLFVGVDKYSNEPVIGGVAPDSIAKSAGLAGGDRVTSVNGKPINTFYELVREINGHPKVPITITFDHEGKSITSVVTPAALGGPVLDENLEQTSNDGLHGAIGVRPKQVVMKVGLAGATKEAVNVPIKTIEGVLHLFRRPSALKEEAGSAVMMVAATYSATEQGIGKIIFLACILSISVGIFNLLPIPPLDGGQMAIAIAEMFRRGRRLSIQVQGFVTNAGVLLVLLLAGTMLVIDIQRFTDRTNPVAAPKKAQPIDAGKR